MDIKSIKALATQHTAAELDGMAEAVESSGSTPPDVSKDPGEYLSDLLQAKEVRVLVDEGTPLNEAVRAFSKRVRGTFD